MRAWAIAALAASVLLGAAASGLALPEDGIAPIEQYTSAKARRLASTYNAQLLKFSEQVYHCLPWVGVVKAGIGFRQPKGVEADDRYLSVWISIDQADDGGAFAALTLERRVSAMFSRYGVDFLRRESQIPGVAADPDVTGFAIVLSWLKPDSAKMPQPVTETLALFVDKGTLAEFLNKKLSAASFADRARFNVFEGKELVGRVPLEVWEDNFNSTFKLKNYVLEKGQKC
jgi:hypothetical protein